MAIEPTEPSAPKSPVIPYLVAALVCDVAVSDPSSGKKNLIGIFDKLWVREFPTESPMSVYVKLTDAEGKYTIKIQFVDVDTGSPLAAAQAEGEMKDRLQAADLIIDFPPLPLPKPGRYEFQVFANDSYLGGAFLDAARATQPG